MARSPARTTSATRLAGVDLGGTKIETVIVDARNTVLGSARRPTPDHGGPPDVAQRSRVAVREACAAASVSRPRCGRRRRLARHRRRRRPATISSARNLPGWEGSFELGPTLVRASSGPPVFVGNDVQVATDAEFELGAGEPYRSLLGVFWGTGVGGGLILDGKPWLGRGGAGEIGHTVVRIGGRRCPLRPPGLHGGLRRPRGDGGAGAQEGREGRQDRPVQADGEARAHAADERDLGARARARRQARDRADRRGGRGARRRDRVGASTCSTSKRWSSAAGSGCASASRSRTGSPTRCSRTCSTTPTAAGRARRRARRPRRRARRGASGA